MFVVKERGCVTYTLKKSEADVPLKSARHLALPEQNKEYSRTFQTPRATRLSFTVSYRDRSFFDMIVLTATPRVIFVNRAMERALSGREVNVSIA